jgi:hypothetical protein
MSHKKTFIGCTIASIAIHLFALYTLQITPSSSKKIAKETNNQIVTKYSKDEILKESFQLRKKDSINKFSEIGRISETIYFKHPSIEKTPLQSSETILDFISYEESVRFSPVTQNIDILNFIPKHLNLKHVSTQNCLPPFPAFDEVSLTFRSNEKVPEIIFSQKDSSIEIDPTSTYVEQHIVSFPSFPKLPTLSELKTNCISEEFDTDLVYYPKEKEEGYFFALTLIPKENAQINKIKQHYTFLIDRSNSIQKERLNATKAAIIKAINELDPDDTFNIIAFDQKIDKFSPQNVLASKTSIQDAEKFLNSIQLGSLFSSADLFKPLFLTIPSKDLPDELYTTILFTDTDSLNKKGYAKNLLHDWTRLNQGKVSLFTLCTQDDQNLSAIDAICSINRGKLIESTTPKAIKRKLLKLIKNIHHPIAKNITCSVITKSKNSNMQIFTSENASSHLYLNQPYVICGESNNLDDFVLFIQAKVKDEWIHIKKNISFLHAKKASTSLKSDISLQKAYDLYKKYAYFDDQNSLLEANALLEKNNLQITFR